jgi:2-keto-4-pentenoate hydratase/2-oxohepta-3-ene-1,7-dioic acid hydratase in catechol pathway
MIFSVAETIALLADVCTLEPGDVLVMGTPGWRRPGAHAAGVDEGGDTIEIEIERIGELVEPDRRRSA